MYCRGQKDVSTIYCCLGYQKSSLLSVVFACGDSSSVHSFKLSALSSHSPLSISPSVVSSVVCLLCDCCESPRLVCSGDEAQSCSLSCVVWRLVPCLLFCLLGEALKVLISLSYSSLKLISSLALAVGVRNVPEFALVFGFERVFVAVVRASVLDRRRKGGVRLEPEFELRIVVFVGWVSCAG